VGVRPLFIKSETAEYFTKFSMTFKLLQCKILIDKFDKNKMDNARTCEAETTLAPRTVMT